MGKEHFYSIVRLKKVANSLTRAFLLIFAHPAHNGPFAYVVATTTIISHYCTLDPLPSLFAPK